MTAPDIGKKAELQKKNFAFNTIKQNHAYMQAKPKVREYARLPAAGKKQTNWQKEKKISYRPSPLCCVRSEVKTFNRHSWTYGDLNQYGQQRHRHPRCARCRVWQSRSVYWPRRKSGLEQKSWHRAHMYVTLRSKPTPTATYFLRQLNIFIFFSCFWCRVRFIFTFFTAHGKIFKYFSNENVTFLSCTRCRWCACAWAFSICWSHQIKNYTKTTKWSVECFFFLVPAFFLLYLVLSLVLSPPYKKFGVLLAGHLASLRALSAV